MKVLHVLDVLTLGGAQGLAIRLIEGLQRRGITNEFCVLLSRQRTHPIWDLPVNPDYLEFHGDYRSMIAWNRCVSKLAATIVRCQPDIVLSTTWLADITTAKACRKAGKPHVAYLVDRRRWMTSKSWRHLFRKRMTRSAMVKAKSQCMAVSVAVADFVARHLPFDRSRIDVVRNSIDVGAFTKIAAQRLENNVHSPLTIGMLSRLEAEKGYDQFLTSIELLLQRGLKPQVLIAGDGTLRDMIECRVAQPPFQGLVSALGVIENARDFYKRCDIFAVPSVDSEGLPTTILEAMASGCAVVATDVGGAAEVIETTVDGIIVPPNEPEKFATALECLLTDETYRHRIQSNAAKRAALEFDVEGMIDRVVEVFTKVLHDGLTTVGPEANR